MSDSGGTTEQTEVNRDLLTRALMEFSGRSLDQVREFMAGKSEDELMNIRNSPKVKVIFERLESESGPPPGADICTP